MKTDWTRFRSDVSTDFDVWTSGGVSGAECDSRFGGASRTAGAFRTCRWCVSHHWWPALIFGREEEEKKKGKVVRVWEEEEEEKAGEEKKKSRGV